MDPIEFLCDGDVRSELWEDDFPMAVTVRASSEISGICNFLSKVAEMENWPLPLIMAILLRLYPFASLICHRHAFTQSNGVKVGKDHLA